MASTCACTKYNYLKSRDLDSGVRERKRQTAKARDKTETQTLVRLYCPLVDKHIKSFTTDKRELIAFKCL